MGLSGVLDVGNAVLVAPIDQRIIAHLAEEMNGNDGFCARCSCRFERDHVNAPVVRFNINKNGCCPHK